MKSPIKALWLYLLLSVWLVAQPSEWLFQSRDRWAAVGDSITQNGTYHNWVDLFYATRFPDRSLELANCGIAGDTAAGMVERFDWDIAPTRPTVATVMAGMNDIDRELYRSDATDAQKHARQTKLSLYARQLEALVVQLESLHCRIQLITPTPFDEAAQIAEPNLPGVNAALQACAQIVRSVASTHGLKVLELQKPMMAWAAVLQKNDPSFSFTNGDRVHPTASTHIAMAYWLLSAQDAPSTVSDIELDAHEGIVKKTINARVSKFAIRDAEIDFTVEAAALPWPVSGDTAQIPFVWELNQENLRITSCAPGNYILTIDGETIGQWDASALARGISLAGKTNTPQYLQALKVRTVVEHKADLMRQLRVIAQVDQWIGLDPRQLPSSDILQKKVTAWKDEAKGTPREAYRRSLARRYLETQPRTSKVQSEINALTQSIPTIAKPLPRVYRLVHIP